MKRILTTFMIGVAGTQMIFPSPDPRPKLVVGIVVDQLRTDYLENLKELFSAGGFRRLMDQGVYLKDLEYNVSPGDATSATAIIQTGTYPRHNGVTGTKIYDPSSKSLKEVFTDPAYIGNFTNETYSPAALRVNTLTDELTIESKNTSRIHSIAPDVGQAIAMAGHTGNSAFWINDETGKWASTTYYPNPPAHFQNINYNSQLVSRLDAMKWTPLRPGEPYPYVSAQDTKDGFKYNFSRSDKDVFSLYKKSPYLNNDITQGAIEYISHLNLGKNYGTTDVLNLGYTLAPFPNVEDGDYRYELEDAYLRLDKDLEDLFKTLDKEVGRDNVVVYLVSTGYFDEPLPDTNKYRLPGGNFSVKRALSLLNAYLSAKYGNGAYVDQYSGQNIYLSKALLEEKGLDQIKIAEEARDFLVRMSGVEDAFTLSDLINPSVPELTSLRQSIDPKTSGDVVLKFNPGWKVVDDSRYPSIEEPNKTAIYSTPGFISGPGIIPKIISEPVDVTAIAPTVAGILRIRPPNSAETKAIKIK